MPRKTKIAQTKAKVVEPEAKPTEAATALARGAKAAAIKAALRAHPKASPKEIAELLTAQGLPTTASYVGKVAASLRRKRSAAMIAKMKRHEALHFRCS